MNNTEDRKDSVDEPRVFDLMDDGAVRVWLEQDAIHLVAFDRPYQDPVELTPAMARKLASVLKEMADRLDD